MPIKKSKTHTSASKKKAASSANSARAKKVASKRSQPAAKSLAAKKAKEERNRKKREELTLKMFEMVYEDYQQGKFHRIF